MFDFKKIKILILMQPNRSFLHHVIKHNPIVNLAKENIVLILGDALLAISRPNIP